MAAYPGAAGFQYAQLTPAQLDAAEAPERKGYYAKRKYVKAGGLTRSTYGPSWAAANSTQRANRKRDRYFGAGRYRRYKRRRRRRRRFHGRGAYGAAPLYRGRGGFWGDAIGRGGWLRKGGLDLVQTGLGHIPVLGGILGGAFGAARKATGIGDYNIASNVLVEGNPHGRMPGTFEAPSFVEITDTGGIVISHREFIGNIYGPSQGVGFKQQKYKINPGIEKTFPWLSQIAANYQDYSIKQLIFSFKSTVSNFQTTTGVTGTVLSVTQHDPYAKDYEDKSEIMQAFGSVSCKATDNQVAGVECDPKKLSGDPIRHVRVAGLPDNRDPKEYDWGEFVFALSDFPAELANANIGEIWVTYTVELLRPRVFTGLGNAISTCHHYLLPDSTQTGDEGAVVIPGVLSGLGAISPNLVFAWDSTATPNVLALLAGETKLWDETLTNHLFENSQNSIDVKIESGQTDALAQYLDRAAAIMPVPFAVETIPGNPDPNPFNQKQLGAAFDMHPALWRVALAGGDLDFPAASPIRNGAGTIKITFPASFNGRVKIIYTIQTASIDTVLMGADANCQGNITGIYDMVSQHAQGSNYAALQERGDMAANTAVCFTTSHTSYASHEPSGNTTTAPGWPEADPGGTGPIVDPVSTARMELHCEIKAVTGGVNNFVLLRGVCVTGVFRSGSVDIKGSPILQASVSVCEYNATMDDKQEVPTIVNVQTGQRLIQDRATLF